MKNTPEVGFRKEHTELGIVVISLAEFREMETSELRFSPHKINFYFILFITDGQGTHMIDFKDYSFEKGTILLFGKGQVHAWDRASTAEGYLIIFNEEFLKHNQIQYRNPAYSVNFNNMLGKPKLQLSNPNRYNTFLTFCSYLHKEYQLPSSRLKNDILQTQLRAIILKIQALSEVQSLDVNEIDGNLFTQFQDLLEEKIAFTRNANDYCHWLEISFRTLNECTKRYTGKTVKAYIDAVLILKAKRKLIQKNKSIKELAKELGFDEATNFTKYFKKQTGISPKDFQKDVQ